MGNNASGRTDHRKAPPPQASKAKKICYYELLGVAATASGEEVKKAFRQKALLLHPDKNQHRIAEATEEFAAVQHAYQTLSDPHERAWYDRNRERILGDKGSSGGQGEEDAPGVDQLMRFFQPGAYRGYGDDPGGFFSVYRQLFEYLEDFEEAEGEPAQAAYTSFGSLHTPYSPSVAAFYDKWLCFQSVRKFYEAEQYAEERADNRQVRRAMAKENQKRREQHRRQYSETVRELAGFVQKRDPRFKRHQEERKQQREQEAKHRKAEQRQRRAQATQHFVEAEWAQHVDDDTLAALLERIDFDAGDERATGSESSASDSEGEGNLKVVSVFDCVVCKKSFKAQAQWLNHCQSKKHKSGVAKLGYDPYEFAFDNDDLDSDNQNKNVFEKEGKEEGVKEEGIEHYKEEKLIDNASEPVVSDSPLIESTNESEKKSKASKKKQKPRRKPKEERNSKANDLKCHVCNCEFDSRNQLFMHINDEGHAELKSTTSSTATKGAKKKR